ncbi:hypothetical protein L2E82_28011 [Cichorium intybus]|uniref:Uncharacterized protein n=1 Tax=Cichorium intybus TaxID=13427 RepID=A0ACB9CUF9_CICIN|nr:hypothetical protein L2E82_28011 [Cichorium intybus]
MRVDKVKQGSGGALRDLFDLNMKSRKKFSSTPDLSEQSKQKRSSDIIMPITQFHPSKRDMSGGLILKGCSSSLIDEDDYGKAPGVVARLMGLDSLPNSSFTDTHSNRFFDSRYVNKRIELGQKDCHEIDRKHKVIEKFQTERLPPKSVPVTPQKHSSPIKNSRFVSSDDPGRIVSKLPSSRKPRQVESNAARNLKGQSMNKSWDGCLQRKPFLEDGKKSVSLAHQAKINVKNREGSSTPKKPSTNSVLKQKNQKQNGVNERGKSAVKSPVSSINLQGRKPVTGKSSSKIPANSMNKTVDQRKRCMDRDKNDRSRFAVKSNGSDVVSFTFTSPISRIPATSTEKKNAFLADNNGRNRIGLNSATGGDSLRTLLDQKLTELTAMSHRARINTTPIYKDDPSSDFSLFKGQELVAVFSKKSTTMEVDNDSEPNYVKYILSDIESMFENFTLGRTQRIVNPRLFGQLEGQRPGFEKKNEPRLRRKLVFDCVSECVDSRCRVWVRGLLIVRRKNRLVKEVCNKILGWEKMKDCMVDELVDMDMSSDEHQKWLDFDVEAFELGVEIERLLLSYLINEAIVDILVQ